MPHYAYWDPKSCPITFGWHEELGGSGHRADLPGTGMFHLQITSSGRWRYPSAACGKLVSWGEAFQGEGAKCQECRKVEESRTAAKAAKTP